MRQKVQRLDERRRRLLHRVLRPAAMVGGSLYQMRRHCGNPRCKCARGQLHASWYLSRGHRGRTQLTYVGRVVPQWLAVLVYRYQGHQKVLAQVRKMDAEISSYLNQLRDDKVRSLEEAQKGHQ